MLKESSVFPESIGRFSVAIVYLPGVESDKERTSWCSQVLNREPPMYEAIPPSRRLKNKIIVEEETLIAENYLERLIETTESNA